MNLAEKKDMDEQSFFQRFGTEEQCVAHLKALRESKGVKCKKCSSLRQSWLSTRCCGLIENYDLRHHVLVVLPNGRALHVFF